MGRTISIGAQDFAALREKKCFYIDKTDFIKEWWESGDIVTLITRPRRFGKTLNMSMLECFFSNQYAGREDLFEGLSIWEEKTSGEEYPYRQIQGTYPVISLSFAGIKENNFKDAREKMFQMLSDLYSHYDFLKESGKLTESEVKFFLRVQNSIGNVEATMSLHHLSDYLSRYYGKKVIILLDEYDTPMQEAYVNGYWEELVSFTRSLFNAAFKTNPYLERGIMTGITRVSKESIFSDLNNLEVVTTSSDKYETAFGFTEQEVFAAMDEMGRTDKKEVKHWYDGFTFGEVSDIYNPWSIINYLDKGKFSTYWANTSSNSLVGKLIREGNKNIKKEFETLLDGGIIESRLDEQIVFNQLDNSQTAIWSFLLASGYLKAVKADLRNGIYELKITNLEVKIMFEGMIRSWFSDYTPDYNDFIKALLLGDVEAMNYYMNKVTLNTFSNFDVGNRPSDFAEPERFYHGFVLGLIVDLLGRYTVTSNRESGFGRYDVLLKPLNKEDNGIILEFKVYNPRREKTLQETARAALQQIEEKQYETVLLGEGVSKEKIKKYGFAFEGKKVLIESSEDLQEMES